MLRNKKLSERRIMCGYRQIWRVVLIALLVCGCATPAYKEVFKDKPAYNSQSFAVNRDILHQATLRAICGRNFIIEKEEQEKGLVLAKRSFQRGKRTIVLVLQANSSSDGAQKTMLFLNAMETTERHYVADRTRFFLWLVPLPGGGGKQGASVKEGERIIEDKTFYKNFFVEIEAEAEKLKQIEASRKREEEISAAVVAPEAEKSAIEEISSEIISQDALVEEEPVEEIVPQETIAPEMIAPEMATPETTLEEVITNETVHEVPLQEEALPVERNITEQPSPEQ